PFFAFAEMVVEPAEAERRRLVGAAVVDVFLLAVVADVLRRENRTVLRVQDVERRAGDDAAAIGLLLRRVREEARADEHRERTRHVLIWAVGGMGPVLAEVLFYGRGGLLMSPHGRYDCVSTSQMVSVGSKSAYFGNAQFSVIGLVVAKNCSTSLMLSSVGD